MIDWITQASEKIYNGDDTSPGTIADVIREHCPFKQDIAYMPVPRCDACKHWKSQSADVGTCSIPGDKNENWTLRYTNPGTGARMWPITRVWMFTSNDFGCVRYQQKEI